VSTRAATGIEILPPPTPLRYPARRGSARLPCPLSLRGLVEQAEVRHYFGDRDLELVRDLRHILTVTRMASVVKFFGTAPGELGVLGLGNDPALRELLRRTRVILAS
jgi:hypothetical protein